MNIFEENLLLSVTRPKELFSLLSEKPNLKYAIGIALAIGLVHGLQLVNDQNMAVFFQDLKNPNLLEMIILAVIGGLMFFLMTVFQVFLNVVYIKIVFYILHIKSNMKILLTVLTFTLVPLLIRDSIGILWKDYVGTLSFGGRYEISYYKTSLAQLVDKSNFTNKSMFYFLSEFEIFTVWSFALGVIAIAVVGKVSYKLSSSIMFLSWLISSLLYLLVLHWEP